MKDVAKKKLTTIQKRMRLLEDIQEAIVNAGGRFYRRNEVKCMHVDKLISMTVRNGITMKVYHGDSEPVPVDPQIIATEDEDDNEVTTNEC